MRHVLLPVIALVACSASLGAAATDPWCPNAFPGAWTPAGFCAQSFTESHSWEEASQLGRPRGMAIAANGDVLVVVRPLGIYVLSVYLYTVPMKRWNWLSSLGVPGGKKNQ